MENFQKCRDVIEKDRLAEKEKAQARQLQSGKNIKKFCVKLLVYIAG